MKRKLENIDNFSSYVRLPRPGGEPKIFSLHKVAHYITVAQNSDNFVIRQRENKDKFLKCLFCQIKSNQTKLSQAS